MVVAAASDLQMRGREWAMLLVLALLWGGSFFFFKVLLTGLPPFTVVLGRVGLAALALNLWLLLRRDPMPARPRLWAGFLLLGLLNNVVPFSLIVFGETRISSGLASILNAMTPIFTVLAAHVLTRNERLTIDKALGVALGFLGVAVLVGPGILIEAGDGTGEAACLMAAFAYAVASIFGRRFRDLPPIKVATGQLTSSTLILLPVVAVADHPWTLAAPGPAVWAALAGIALLSTVLAYILFFRILAAAGAVNLALVTFLIPGFALLLGWLFLGETLSARQGYALLLIGAGLAAIDGRVRRRLGL